MSLSTTRGAELEEVHMKDGMKHLLSCVAAAIALAGARQSLAQSQPARAMPPDPYDPQPAQASAPAVVYPAPNDFPSAEVQAVPPAFARMVELRWTRENSRRDLTEVVDRLRDDFEHSPEMLAAADLQKAAHDRFISARNNAINGVRTEARYTTLRKMAADLQRRIELMQEQNPKPSPEAIRAFADLRLEYSTQATAMEVDALAADSEYLEARQTLLDAALRVRQLRNDFERGLRRNAEFVTARNVFRNLGTAYLASDAYLQSTVSARNIALNYAYWVRRYDQYRFATPYRYWRSPYDHYGSPWRR